MFQQPGVVSKCNVEVLVTSGVTHEMTNLCYKTNQDRVIMQLTKEEFHFIGIKEQVIRSHCWFDGLYPKTTALMCQQ